MDYKKAYFKLFNEITRVTSMLDVVVFSLKQIQQKTEQIIIADERKMKKAAFSRLLSTSQNLFPILGKAQNF
jgi:hypothetical protein